MQQLLSSPDRINLQCAPTREEGAGVLAGSAAKSTGSKTLSARGERLLPRHVNFMPGHEKVVSCTRLTSPGTSRAYSCAKLSRAGTSRGYSCSGMVLARGARVFLVNGAFPMHSIMPRAPAMIRINQTVTLYSSDGHCNTVSNF